MIFILLLPFIAVVAAAPFGATICGAIALSQIRRSGGRLYGLGLALFDTLVFPLLLLDGLIAWGLMGIFHVLFNPFGGGVWAPGEYMAAKQAWYALIALVCLLVDFLIVFWAWRAAKKPVGADSAGTRDVASGNHDAVTETARHAVKLPGIIVLFIRVVYAVAVLVAMWPFFGLVACLAQRGTK